MHALYCATLKSFFHHSLCSTKSASSDAMPCRTIAGAGPQMKRIAKVKAVDGVTPPWP